MEQQKLEINEVLNELTTRFSNRVAELERECAISNVLVKKLQKENKELSEKLSQNNSN